MTHVIDGRSGRADRNHTRQVETEWLTAEELGRHLNLSANAIREILARMGHKCQEAKKPTKTAFKTGLARQFHHHGKKIFKWNRKEILPEIKEYLKVHEKAETPA